MLANEKNNQVRSLGFFITELTTDGGAYGLLREGSNKPLIVFPQLKRTPEDWNTAIERAFDFLTLPRYYALLWNELNPWVPCMLYPGTCLLLVRNSPITSGTILAPKDQSVYWANGSTLRLGFACVSTFVNFLAGYKGVLVTDNINHVGAHLGSLSFSQGISTDAFALLSLLKDLSLKKEA